MSGYSIDDEHPQQVLVKNVLVKVEHGIPRRMSGGNWHKVCRQYPDCVMIGNYNGFCRSHRHLDSPEGWEQVTVNGVLLAVKDGVARRKSGKYWVRLCKKYPECMKLQHSGGFCRAHAHTDVSDSVATPNANQTPVEIRMIDGIPHKIGWVADKARDWKAICKEYPQCTSLGLVNGFCRSHAPRTPSTRSLRTVLGKSTSSKHDTPPKTVEDAIDADDKYALRRLLQEGRSAVSINTLLLAAAEDGKVNCLSSLLDMKANVDAATEYKSSALSIAAHQDRLPCVRLLLEGGADPNSVNRYGFSPLSRLQTRVNRLAIAKLLLDARADASHANNRGTTVLMNAARIDKSGDLTVLLLEYGADKTPIDTHGKSALDIARESNHALVVSRLESSQKYWKPPLEPLPRRKHPAAREVADQQESSDSESDDDVYDSSVDLFALLIAAAESPSMTPSMSSGRSTPIPQTKTSKRPREHLVENVGAVKVQRKA